MKTACCWPPWLPYWTSKGTVTSVSLFPLVQLRERRSNREEVVIPGIICPAHCITTWFLYQRSATVPKGQLTVLLHECSSLTQASFSHSPLTLSRLNGVLASAKKRNFDAKQTLLYMRMAVCSLSVLNSHTYNIVHWKQGTKCHHALLLLCLQQYETGQDNMSQCVFLSFFFF